MRDNRPLLSNTYTHTYIYIYIYIYAREKVQQASPGLRGSLVANRERDFAVRSVDARDRTVSMAERWSDDSVFSNRAHFILDKHPAQLGVDRIKEEDAGIYRCRVDFQIGQTRNSKVNLTVIGK